MKCINCLRIQPPPRGMPGFCACPDDASGTLKSLRYERECSRFAQITEVQRDAKREEWQRILKPVPRAKMEEEK